MSRDSFREGRSSAVTGEMTLAAAPPLAARRRTFLAQALAAAGMVSFAPVSALSPPMLLVANVTGLYSVEVARVETPRSTGDVVAAVRAWPGQVAVGGGRYSMGGQVAVRGGLHLDMRTLAGLVWLRPEDRRVRVQAGMRWRDLQDHIDPLGLAVRTMQSYSNFTIGGSVSVNGHGRYVNHGPIGHTVRALQLVLADGTVVEATPREHAPLFRAAIGGYGAIGVITEVELELSENVPIERVVEAIPLAGYVEHFQARIAADPAAVLHNANLLPPAFDAPVAVTWRRAGAGTALTDTQRLIPRGRRYAKEQDVIWALTELPGGNEGRKAVERLQLKGPAVQWLNHEASLDVASLEPRTREFSTYVLQEYFIPPRHFEAFARGMGQVLRAHRVLALNISLRHSPADTVSLLPWAREEVFCFVLYFKQRVRVTAQEEVAVWTRELVDLALKHEGRYYLPYQLHATREQFGAAYPEIARLRDLKREVDPGGKFANELWRKYL